MAELRVHHVPGGPAESGFAHGRELHDLLTPAFLEAYVARLGEVIRFTREDLTVQAMRWLAGLPPHYREEIVAMGAGAGVGTTAVVELLYADIARSSPAAAGEPRVPGEPGEPVESGEPGESAGEEAPIGPMCSAVVARLADEATWIARNCDWLVPTLMRGTAAVVHETPHRIPVMAVGIRGDIDVDTGINAERLWLHLHTLQASDDPPADRTCISWLFWAREALETCASLDELECFVESTGRDRGVFVVAGDGKTNEAAIFECSRGGHVRHDTDPAQVACVTNHTLARDVGTTRKAGGFRGTVGRYRAMRERLQDRVPREGPTDLIALLADPNVEMRTPRWLRTIYAAVVRPSDASIWFAAGGPDGTPAASGGRWAPVRPPWERGTA